MNRPPRHALLTAVLAAALWTAPARAQGDALARARTLANEGGDLLDKKQYAEALEKVTQAEELFHAPTHLLMIGEAQEQLGHLADATATFERLAAEPLPSKSPIAFKKAQEEGQKHLRSLLARVPSILVEVQGSPAEATRVTLDGRALDISGGVAIRVDPGEHEVRAEADGFAAAHQKVTLPEKGGVVKVQLALKPEQAEREAVAPAVEPEAPKPPASDGSGRRVPAFIAFGVGAAGVGFGVVTGLMSLHQVSVLGDECPSGRCTAEQQPIIDKAGTLGTLSTIGFVVGGAGVVAGVVLLVTAPSTPRVETTGLARPWRPSLDVGPGTVRLSGTF